MSVTLTTPMLKTGSVYTIYVNEEGIGCWDTTKKNASRQDEMDRQIAFPIPVQDSWH